MAENITGDFNARVGKRTVESKKDDIRLEGGSSSLLFLLIIDNIIK